MFFFFHRLQEEATEGEPEVVEEHSGTGRCRKHPETKRSTEQTERNEAQVG
jgi:hypothetical protein